MRKRIVPTALGLGLAATLALGIGTANAAVQDSYTVNGYTFVQADLQYGKPMVPSNLRGRDISLWHEAWNKAKSAYERDLHSSPVVAPSPGNTGGSGGSVDAAKTYTVNGYTFTEADLKYGKPQVPSELRGREISQWHEAWNKAKSAYEQDIKRR